MTKKIIWRLSEKPSTESLRGLVNDKILTNQEARQILFSETEENERTIESYQQEIKFLRELIVKLSEQKKIIEVVREYNHPHRYPWFEPYYTWSNPVNYSTSSGTLTIDATPSEASSDSFSDIVTF